MRTNFLRGKVEGSVVMSKIERPIISDLKRSPMDWALEVLAILGIVFTGVAVVYYWPSLPDSIPRHFNARGEPNAWGSKGWSLVVPVLSVLIYVLLTVVAKYMHRANYLSSMTEENARRQYELIRQFLVTLKTTIVLVFAYLVRANIEVALGRQEGLGTLFLPTVIVLIAAIIGSYLARAYRAR